MHSTAASSVLRSLLESLRSGAALTVIAALPRAAVADASFAPKPEAWRKFEITTRIEVLDPSGETQVWVPAAMIRETRYQKTLANRFRAANGAARLVETRADADPLRNL